MKKTQEIIGLPVFSIVDGREIGEVKDLVVNPEEGMVEYLLINGVCWYEGARVLPYRAVLGVGVDAVTTESTNLLIGINESTDASTLVQRNVRVKGTKVLTRKGNLIGNVIEFEVDENTGKITSIEFQPQEGDTQVIASDKVLTFGKDVLVVDDKLAGTPMATEADAAVAGDESSLKAPSGNGQSEAARLFVERQKQFLMGKKVIQDIKDEAGNILIAEGSEIDERILEIADSHGKLIELSQYIRQ